MQSKGFIIAAAVAAVGAAMLIGTPAAAQFFPPPPEYIASTEPVYFEGHAIYWYDHHCVWRDEHGVWNHYDREPAFLADRRSHSPPIRRSWGRAL